MSKSELISLSIFLEKLRTNVSRASPFIQFLGSMHRKKSDSTSNCKTIWTSELKTLFKERKSRFAKLCLLRIDLFGKVVIGNNSNFSKRCFKFGLVLLKEMWRAVAIVLECVAFSPIQIAKLQWPERIGFWLRSQEVNMEKLQQMFSLQNRSLNVEQWKLIDTT